MNIPKAILFDLDDTLISAYGNPEAAWKRVVDEFRGRLDATMAGTLASEISAAAQVFWSDEVRHKAWRHTLPEARQEIVRQVFHRRGLTSEALTRDLACRYTRLRDDEMFVFPGVVETLQALSALDISLGLITNGSGPVQRAKIERFSLAGHFSHIQIEGEHGFGKPDSRAYLHALAVLGTAAHETWIVGDNLVWEVEAPQQLGIHAVWYDGQAKGIPPESSIRPDRIVQTIPDVLSAFPGFRTAVAP